ncbi:MAG: helix-turn-helix transcriptional regulator [bacterium]
MPKDREVFSKYALLISRKRESLSLTQEQVGKRMGGTSYQQISRYERGGVPNFSTRKKLDQALGITRLDYTNTGIEELCPDEYEKRIPFSHQAISQAMLEAISEQPNKTNLLIDLEWLIQAEKTLGFAFDRELCLILLSKRADREEEKNES